MKKVGTLVLCAVAITAVVNWKVAPVQAFPPFKKEFENLYVKAEPATAEEKALKEAAETNKCGICHTGPEGKNKKVRNTYGKAISKLIPEPKNKEAMDALKKNPEKIKEILEKAAKEPSDPKDPTSPTFGDLIKEGKLPGKEVAEDAAK
jgi:hypothetical protein